MSDSQRPIRWAVLVCDTHMPFISIAGDYHCLYTALLRDACQSVRVPHWTLDPYDVIDKMEYPPDTTDYDGILISGSKFSAYEKVHWIDKLVAYVADLAVRKPHVKIFGICFGHQIIARALGGECVFGGKWEVGTTTVHHTDVGRQIFGTPTLNIQQMHKDHVPVVPPNFHIIGSTLSTYNQGMVRFSPSSTISSDPSVPLRLTDIHILTIEGHPEFTQAVTESIIAARVSSGQMDEQTAKDARSRATWENNGVSVGKTMWGVLGIQC